MKAVVMAGGEGSRLRPLTCNLPKPLVSIANKPVMSYIIELLKSHGIEEIIVTLQYLADEIVSYFGDGSDFGVKIIYSFEDEPLGTAGSIKKVEKYLDGSFLIISGDALTDIDLTKAIKFHKTKASRATIVLTRVENPLEYGVVIVEDNGRIRRFLEKPSWGEVFSDNINTGIYVLEPEILSCMEEGKAYDFSKDIFPSLLEKEIPLYGFVTSGYWTDIGNFQQYRQAQYDVFSGKVKANISGKRIKKGIWVGEGTEIHPKARLQGPLVIGKNCRIGKRVTIDELSSIGDNCIIEEDAKIHSSILWKNIYAGSKSRFSSCIVCRGTTVKPSAVISEGAVIGDKCFIGQGAVIQPQVKIWPEKNVEAGATVSMSLIWGIKWPGSIFGENGIEGLANIEITPEFALKLGAAYGAFLEKSSFVATSRSDHPAARMLNRAIICGLISVGVNVYDLRVLPSPVSRHAIRSAGIKGGIHVKPSAHDPCKFLIQFLDKSGINIHKRTERSIENIFFREDFRRTSSDEVGKIDFPARIVDKYLQQFFNLIDKDLIKEASFKIVIDYGFGSSSLVLPLILGNMGIETVALNAYLDAVKSRDVQTAREGSLLQLSNIVKTLKADLGIFIDSDAERISVVDEKGTVITDQLLLAVFSRLVLKNSNLKLLATPVTAPLVIDKLVEDYGCKAIRTKVDSRSITSATLAGEKKIGFAGDLRGGFIFPEFQPCFDAMFAFAKLLEFLAKEKCKLSQIVEKIPKFYTGSRKIECTWHYKGKIMRQLIEQNKNRKLELLEGIKIFTDKGWVSILPDPIDPYLHLSAEAKSLEILNKILNDYQEILEKMKSQESIITTRIKEKFKFSAVSNSILPLDERISTPGGQKDSKKLVLPEEKAFYFWSDGGYLGFHASNLKQFVEILHYIQPESLVYHFKRGDFEKWLEYELELKDLAGVIDKLHKKDLNPEELREKLINIFSQSGHAV